MLLKFYEDKNYSKKKRLEKEINMKDRITEKRKE